MKRFHSLLVCDYNYFLWKQIAHAVDCSFQVWNFLQQANESIVILHNILHIPTMNVNFEIYEFILLQKSWTFFSNHGPKLYINKSFGMKFSIWKIMSFDSVLHPHNHLSYTDKYTTWNMVFHEHIFGFIMNGDIR